MTICIGRLTMFFVRLVVRTEDFGISIAVIYTDLHSYCSNDTVAFPSTMRMIFRSLTRTSDSNGVLHANMTLSSIPTWYRSLSTFVLEPYDKLQSPNCNHDMSTFECLCECMLCCWVHASLLMCSAREIQSERLSMCAPTYPPDGRDGKCKGTQFLKAMMSVRICWVPG
jgi:hypothetical protein